MFSVVEVQTQPECNRSCPYCPVGTIEQDTLRLDRGIFEKIVDDLAEIGFEGRFSPHRYNEPLLDERLPELIRYVDQTLPEVHILLVTNGDLLSPEKYHELIHVGVDEFTVTHHWKEEENGYSCKMSENTRRLREKLSDEDKEFIRFQRFDTERNLYNRGGTVDTLVNEHSGNCPIYAGNWDEMFQVDSDGNVLLCCHQYDHNHGPTFGNVTEEKPTEIWNSERFRQARAALARGEKPFKCCEECKLGNIDPQLVE